MGAQKRKIKLLLRLTALLAALLVLGVTAVNAVMILGRRGDILTADAIDGGNEYILILGSGLNADGTPGRLLQARLETGAQLYAAGAADKVIASGDNGSLSDDEVSVMRDTLVGLGVAAEDIICDYGGLSTYESIWRAADYYGAKRLVVVTQQYHLYRALYICDSFGLEAVGCAAPFNTDNPAYHQMREILARCKTAVYCLFKPLPTYVGETAPLAAQ